MSKRLININCSLPFVKVCNEEDPRGDMKHQGAIQQLSVEII